MHYEDLMLLLLELVFAIGLYILAGYSEKVVSSKWRLCYGIPFIVCLFGIAFFGFEVAMLGTYLGAFLLLVGFFKEKGKTRKGISGIAGGVILLSLILCNVYSGYRQPDYEEDFKQGFAEMKAHYVLTWHKEIDWDSLYEKYLPRFEDADNNHDAVAACLAWNDFVTEFGDGHVTYTPNSETLAQQASEQICGNDYGLSLMLLSNGKVVAVNVEPDSALSKAGIHNGTVITAWDGEKIEDAIKTAEETCAKLQNYASRENEAFYRAIPVAGMGGDSVSITYLDDSGEERQIKADRIGAYADRWKNTVEIIDKGREISNLTWEELDEETALMRMRFMSYDAKENYDAMEQELRTKLLELKEAGVTNLIFDLRSNGGGSGSYVKHIVKLIAPEGEHIYAYDGVFDKDSMQYKKGELPDTYEVGECETYQGENLWEHGQIILLVNSATVSAGDHFTQLASAFPNVTVMGFTHSNCSAQGVNMVTFDYGVLSYSAVLLLQEDGTVFIDTDSSREATVPLDVKIPFDEEAVKILFQDGGDYALDYARQYLSH